jgi:hypothetical protein
MRTARPTPTAPRPAIPTRREQVAILAKAEACLAGAQMHGRDEKGERLLRLGVRELALVVRARWIEGEWR